VNGLPVRPGLVLAAEPGVEVGFVSEAGYQSVAYLVSARELGAHLAARRLEREFRLPRGVEVLQVSPEQGHRLFAWANGWPSSPRASPPVSTPAGRSAARRGPSCSRPFSPRSPWPAITSPAPATGPAAQSLVVKRAEDFALSRAGENLQVGDLCCAAGVSERTLQYAFKEILGTTPMAYLVRLRLHRVRRALLAARRGTTTVSAAALKCGFWHFGEFSRAYRSASASCRPRPCAAVQSRPAGAGSRHPPPRPVFCSEISPRFRAPRSRQRDSWAPSSVPAGR